jgi:hypothetical protein
MYSPGMATCSLPGKVLSNLQSPQREAMDLSQFKSSLARETPDATLTAPLAALWWDAKGDWTRAHALVDELETRDGMAVHAYLHRKEGSDWNADYWYKRSGRDFHRSDLDAEWGALVEGLLSRADAS